jgi:hypothetical protein
MSSEIAIREGSSIVPGTTSDRVELHAGILALAQRLDVVTRLKAYGAALRYLESRAPTDRYWILELDTARSQLRVRGYRDPVVAADAYGAIERAAEAAPEQDVVLVSVNTVTGLQRAYPNYYLDTSAFSEIVREVTGL